MMPRYRRSWRARGANSTDAGRLTAMYAWFLSGAGVAARAYWLHALCLAERNGQYITSD